MLRSLVGSEMCIRDSHQDDLYHVLVYLPPRDLLQLALTCRSMRDLVYMFCSSTKKQDEMKTRKFFSSTDCLLPFEKTLQITLESSNSPLLIYKIGKGYANRRRISCLNVDTFPHSSNPEYFERSRNEYLERDVVTLITVCWLEIKHEINNVLPGQYHFVMRLMFTEDFSWPSGWGDSNDLVRFKVSWNDGDGSKRSIEMNFPSSLWDEIRDFIVDDKPIENMPVNCAFEKNDNEHGWFNIRILEPICLLAENTDVFCQFSDIENGWWKSGIAWDFIELVPCN